MTDTFNELILNLRLAQAFKTKWRLPDRDRALVLAAVRACELDIPPLAAFCRKLVLQNNHGHMVRKWDSIQLALEDPDFLHFCKQLERKLPVDQAETTLQELGVKCDLVAENFPDDASYAAAVLGVEWEWLSQNFG